MDNRKAGRLVGTETHGFRTMEDLDLANVLEEAKTRWLRPNEIHAILCNHKYFKIQVKPVTLPASGTMVLFDRKMLRNFRKDGHNWKKKKDGKTVKEAHEHLKVGNEERIHVYYAHGEDNPTFVRRCYWLLDKSLEHIVLVHYRETQESKVAPATPGNSNSSSGNSDPSASLVISEESDSVLDQAYCSCQRADLAHNESSNIKDHELKLHEINTLEWDELLVSDDSNRQITAQEGGYSVGQPYHYEINGYRINSDSLSANKLPAESYLENLPGQVSLGNPVNINVPAIVGSQAGAGQITLNPLRDSGMITMGTGNLLEYLIKDGLQTQDSFGRWINDIITDSPVSADDVALESSISTSHQSYTSPSMGPNFSSVVEQIFYITDISPSSASSTEETKILVVGYFHEGLADLVKSNVFCNCGDVCSPAAVVQPGVFRFIVSPQAPGVVNLFLSFDGHKPISQVVTFEFRAPLIQTKLISSEEKPNWEDFQVQLRLAHLLFSASRTLDVLSSKVSPHTLREARKFADKTSNIADNWAYLTKLIKAFEISLPEAKDTLFELTLQNRLYEWLLERVIEGRKITERDEQGQGVIHLCAILGYTWAVYPFSWSGLSLDYRDKYGWTALHWAAYYGREKMVAKLLSAGAKANLVTDPTPENPGGYIAADLASKNGHDGLGAYLAEKGLVQHFEEMTLAGNVSGSLQTVANTDDSMNTGNFTEEEIYLKNTLAAYRTAADAAARIQTAFREHSLKVQTKAVELSNPEIEARNIVAALKIQHAFRNYESRKKLAAAARIQHRFRAWKMRREFLNMRRHAIKIQAVFRGFQVRRQYRKIIWSVGVLEKAILRWRLKRKGFRGLQVQSEEAVKDQTQENDAEEDFFQASRKLAEERVERSIVRVQAMFRSKRAQEEYARMKLEHNTAALEYEELQNPHGMTE